jgi:hypothetical protein
VSRRPDLTGRRFGRLVAIAPAERPARVTGPTRDRRDFWSLECDCGGTRTACHRDLLAGSTRSCGCINRELGDARAQRLTLAGESLTIAEWAARTGHPRQRIYDRLRDGWTVERTLTTPGRRWVRRVEP